MTTAVWQMCHIHYVVKMTKTSDFKIKRVWEVEWLRRGIITQASWWRWQSETGIWSKLWKYRCQRSSRTKQGSERGEPEEKREVRKRWRCVSESPSQTNVCLSVWLGRHVSASADWAPLCSLCGSLPWTIIHPLQDDTYGIITTYTGKRNMR